MNLDHEMQRLWESLQSPSTPPVAKPPTVDEVMARVRAEVARRRGETALAVGTAPSAAATLPDGQGGEPLTLPRWSPAPARLAYRTEYRLDDLLVFADRDFVEQCFRVVLRRPPDRTGFDHYLDKLRRGDLSKVEVLGEIRFSPEGRQRGVHVDGLLLPYTLQRWGRKRPFGRFLRWAQGLFRLGAFQHRINLQDAAQGRDVHETGILINQVASDVEGALQGLRAETHASLAAVAERLKDQAARDLGDAKQGLEARVEEQQQQWSAALDAIEARIGGLPGHDALHELQGQIAIMRQALATAEERRTAAIAALAAEQSKLQEHLAAGLADTVRASVVESLSQGLRRVEARAAAAEARAEALAAELAAARGQYAGMREDWRRALEAHSTQQRAELDMQAHVQAAAIEAQEQRLSAQLVENDARVDGLRAEVSSIHVRMDEQARALHSQQNDSAAHRAESAAMLDSVRDEMSSLRVYAVEQGDAISARFEEWDAVMRRDVYLQHNGLAVVVDSLKADLEHLRRDRVAGGAFERRMLDDVQHIAGRLDRVEARIHPIEEIERRRRAEAEASREALDGLYAAFEERFRGSRELIHQRVAPYVEWVRQVGAGTREAPVLDVGCGRGEWLEILRDQQLHGRGIDLNRVFAEVCRGRGLEVDHAEALQALRALPEASVGALTSMHLVEHLPFETVIALLDEARRVIRPGGLLLLETPNPENLTVGACWFYMDPTHRNPIPPEALRWVVESRGFHGVRIERLTVGRDLPWPGRVPDTVPGAATINAMSDQFTVAPDYAVLGLRP